MNIDKTKVYVIGGGMLIAAGILSAGPRATSVALELGMFHYKMAVVCFAIGFCLKSEEKR